MISAYFFIRSVEKNESERTNLTRMFSENRQKDFSSAEKASFNRKQKIKFVLFVPLKYARARKHIRRLLVK